MFMMRADIFGNYCAAEWVLDNRSCWPCVSQRLIKKLLSFQETDWMKLRFLEA